MRPYKKIVRDEFYFNLIMLIVSGKNTAKKITDYRRKNEKGKNKLVESATYQSLKRLEKEGYIELVNKNIPKRFKTKEYQIRWGKIIEEIIEFLRNRIKPRLERREYDIYKNKIIQNKLSKNFLKVRDFLPGRLHNNLNNKEFIGNLKENKYLIFFFKEYFKEIKEIYKKFTLYETFEMLSMNMNLQVKGHDFSKFGVKDGEIPKLLKKDKFFRDLNDLGWILNWSRIDPIPDCISELASSKLNKEIAENYKQFYQ